MADLAQNLRHVAAGIALHHDSGGHCHQAHARHALQHGEKRGANCHSIVDIAERHAELVTYRCGHFLSSHRQ